MSKPSFSNIDLWLFELVEGNLSPEQVEQLEMFILQHPELDFDRDAWELSKVKSNPVLYPHAEQFKKKRKIGGVYLFTSVLVLFLLIFGVYSYVNYSALFDSNVSVVVDEGKQYEQLLKQIRELNESYDSQGVAKSYGKVESSFLLKNQAVVASNNVSTLSGVQLSQNDQLNNLNETGMATIVNDVVVSDKGANEVLSDEYATDAIEENDQNESIDLANSRTNVVDESEQSEDIKVTANRNTFDNKLSYSSSLKKKLTKFGRTIQRMMDNPVALKNSRDIDFNIPGMTSNDINFSSAGTLLATRFQTLSRLQWVGEKNQQLSNQLSIDGYAYQVRGGWSLQLNHVYYGDGGIQQGQLALTFSPKISVSNRVSVEPSLRFKMGNKRLNADKISPEQTIELDRGNDILFSENGATPLGKSLWYKDLGAGMLVNTQWFFAGIQVDNLFRHIDNIYSKDIEDPRRATNKIVASVGTSWLNQRKNIELSPYLVYQNDDQLSELWLGSSIRWNWFQFGVASTNKLEPSASLGVKFKHFSMNYHADYTTSAMTGEKALSHQVSLRIIGKQNRLNR